MAVAAKKKRGKSPAKKLPAGSKKTSKKAKKTKRKRATTRRALESGVAFNEAISERGFVEAMVLSNPDCLAHLLGKVRTGSVALDEALRGGIPYGRITEIFGQYHIGKTTLLNLLFAQAQREDGWGVVADSETAMSVGYTTEKLGVDPKRLTYLQFDRDKLWLETILVKIIESIVWWRKNDPDRKVVIGLDSLGGAPVMGEKAKLMPKPDEKRQPGAAARVMQLFRRDVCRELAHTNIALVVINHQYSSWGGGKTRKVAYGGEALEAASSVKLNLYSCGNWLKRSDGVVVGREVRAEITKDKIEGRTNQVARLAMLHGVGVDNLWSVFEELKTAKVIETNGSWSAVNLDGEVLKFQGWAGLQRLCAQDQEQDGGGRHLFDRLVSVYQAVKRGELEV